MGYILTSLGFFTKARSTTHTGETNGEMMVRNQREELEKKKKTPHEPILVFVWMRFTKLQDQ